MKKNKAKANRKAQELSNKEQKGKLIKEEKEHIDNMVVLATAIGLVGAIVLLCISILTAHMHLRQDVLLMF